ncbi:MAG: hypothetical protein M5U28_30620 [Sandaracinaceae bacterium]|nr:hypothetical protein [Sandaracinaceae bacterium]
MHRARAKFAVSVSLCACWMSVLLFAFGACGAPAEPSPAEPSPPSDTAEAPPDTEAGLLCEPVTFCGCHWECALVREQQGAYVRLDSEGDQLLVRDDCARGPCFQRCVDDVCEPALVAQVSCDESCPPSRAPFACRRVEGEPIDATGRPCQPAP